MPEMGKSAGHTRAKARSTGRGRAGQPPGGRLALADALFTTTQQRVLALLFGQPERSFFASELIGLAQSGSGAVQRELGRLLGSGLIQTRTVGRQRHYQANVATPIYQELRNIVVKTFGVVDPLRIALEPLKSRIRNAFVYGSMAKQQAVAQSDIDLLVVGDDLLLEELYSALTEVEKQLGRKINPTLYSSAEFARRVREGNAFLSRVLKGPTIPLIGALEAHASTRESRKNR